MFYKNISIYLTIALFINGSFENCRGKEQREIQARDQAERKQQEYAERLKSMQEEMKCC